MAKTVSLRVPEELLARVDEARGKATRTEYTLRALEAAVGGQPQPVPVPKLAPPAVTAQRNAGAVVDYRAMMRARQQRLNRP